MIRFIGFAEFVPRKQMISLATFLKCRQGRRARTLLEELDLGLVLLQRRWKRGFVTIFLDAAGVHLARGYIADRTFTRSCYQGKIKRLNTTMIDTFFLPRKMRRAGGNDVVRYIKCALNDLAENALTN